MATHRDVEALETTLGRYFVDFSIGKRALTSAGSDATDLEGNRTYAFWGRPLLELYVLSRRCLQQTSRASIQAVFDHQMSKRSLADTTVRLGIDKLIRYSPRGGKGSPKVLCIALRAIVGAVWIDSGKDKDVLFSVIDHFNFLSNGLDCRPPSVHCDGLDLLQQSICTTTQANSIQASLQINASGGRSEHTDSTLDLLASCTSASNREDEPLFVDPVLLMPSLSIDNFCLPTPSSGLEPVINLSGTFWADISMESPFSSVTSCQGESLHIDPLALESQYELHNTDQRQLVSPSGYFLIDENADHTSRCDASQIGTLSSNDSASSRRVKRRRPLRDAAEQEQLLKSESYVCMLSEWIAADDERRSSPRHSPDTMSWSREAITSSKVRLGEHNIWDKLLPLCLHRTGDSDALVHVKKLIIQGRACSTEIVQAAPAQRLTFSERFQAIKRLEYDMTYLRLMWRCHILKLIEECQEQSLERTNTFFNSTPESISRAMKTSRGNPRHLAGAQLTERMMQQAFPNLHQSSPQYMRERRYMSSLRRMGTRLVALKGAFGPGLLAIACLDELDGYCSPKISNLILHGISDDLFAQYLELLCRTQGNLLRQLSQSLSDTVTRMCDGTLRDAPPLILESIHDDEIRRFPKGSQQLYALLERDNDFSRRGTF